MGTSGTGSNYCVTDDSVYVRRGNTCLRIDARTGELIAEFTAPPTADEKEGVWGYISSEDGFLFGSLADQEHVVTYRYRPGGDMNDQLTESKTFFALDAKTGKLKWRYDAEHSLRHNGIAIAGGVVILIDRPLATVDRRRDGKAAKDDHPTGALVALNSGSGDVLWRNTNDIYGTVSAISAKHHTLMMSYQPTRFRLVSEIGGRISAFNLSDGELLWEKNARYDSRPVINDRTIYAQGGAWDLITGEDRPFNFKRSYGCGVLAGSRDMMVFRSATLGYFDLTKNETTEDFGGIRPGCWINVIPAGGLVFAPDASAGCKCSYLNQSWIALQPDGTRAPIHHASFRRLAQRDSSGAESGPARPAIHSLHARRLRSDPGIHALSPTHRHHDIRTTPRPRLHRKGPPQPGRRSQPSSSIPNCCRWTRTSGGWRTLPEPIRPAPGPSRAGPSSRPPMSWSAGGASWRTTLRSNAPAACFSSRTPNLFSDGELSFEMNSADDDGVGVALALSRARTTTTSGTTHSQRPFRALAVKQGERYEVLAANKRGFERRKWLQIKIVFAGSKITGYIDGEKDFEVDDPTYAERRHRILFLGQLRSAVPQHQVR